MLFRPLNGKPLATPLLSMEGIFRNLQLVILPTSLFLTVINLVLFVVAYCLYKDPSEDENYAPALIPNDGAKHNGDAIENGSHSNGNIIIKGQQQPKSVQMSDLKVADM